MLLFRLIDLYSFIVIADVVISWIGASPYNPIVRVITGLVEPVLDPIRRVLPPLGGLDFSPWVLLILLQVLKQMLI
ncbi:MAG: YggT family protein [Acidobacteriota bacterium]|nr:YggT family protein [Acidobacteriota bacterium]